MLAALSLALFAAAATANTTEASGEIVLYNGHSVLFRADSSFELPDEGEVYVASVVAGYDDSKVGVLAYAVETGRLYGQGEHDAGRWVLDGQCDEDACEVTVASTSGTSVASVVVSAAAAAFRDQEETVELGAMAFSVEWGGGTVAFSDVYVEKEVGIPGIAESSDGDDGLILSGLVDLDTGDLWLSWLAEDGSGDLALMEGQVGQTGGGLVVFAGDAGLWRGETGFAASMSF